jgi:hypothetical protein
MSCHHSLADACCAEIERLPRWMEMVVTIVAMGVACAVGGGGAGRVHPEGGGVVQRGQESF